MKTQLRWLASCLFMITSAVMAATASADPLTIGSVSRNIKKEIRDFQPLADYLDPRLEVGDKKGAEIIVLPTAVEMVQWLQDGAIDIYIDSPFIAAQVARETGAKPLLRRWKRGVGEYRSFLFTLANSGIRSIDDLKGKVVAFEKPHSSTGYLLPKVMLVQRGFRLVEVDQPDSTVPPDSIGYVFTRHDHATVDLVLRRKVAAGATDTDYFESALLYSDDELAVLQRSPSIPRQVVIYRGDLDQAVVDEVERLLLAMSDTPEGRLALAAFEATTRFDPIPGGAEEAFARFQSMLELLRKPLN